MRAIDNHSHPPALVAAGQKDDEFDALPCDPLEPTNPTITTRPENPMYLAAWKGLFGYKYNDASPEHLRELLAAKQKIKNEQGDKYPAWVLDKLGVRPLLDLDMRLGEGSGAALAMVLAKTALHLHQHMATFSSAGVSNKD